MKGRSMPTSIATLEVDVRRCSPDSLLRKLEKTMGVQLNIRRARVTPRRCWLLLEVPEGPPASILSTRKIG
jgi:hypothetical protein